MYETFLYLRTGLFRAETLYHPVDCMNSHALLYSPSGFFARARFVQAALPRDSGSQRGRVSVRLTKQVLALSESVGGWTNLVTCAAGLLCSESLENA